MHARTQAYRRTESSGSRARLHGSNPIHGEARDDLGKLEECKVRFADKPEIDPSVQVIGLRMNCGSSTFGWFADQT
jgi:hypothetical protein